MVLDGYVLRRWGRELASLSGLSGASHMQINIASQAKIANIFARAKINKEVTGAVFELGR